MCAKAMLRFIPIIILFLSVFAPAQFKSPKSAADFYNRGLERHNAGDLDGAIADYSAAIQRDPNDADSWNNRANAKNSKGERDSAILDYNRAILLAPTNHTYYLNRAGVRRFLGDLDGAMADFNRVLELVPKYAPGYNNRGVVKRQRGDLDGAFADFNRAIELVPAFALAIFNRGVVYDDRGKLTEALADYNRALELDPKIAGARNNRGSIHYRQLNFEKALYDLDEAVKLSSGTNPGAVAARTSAYWNRAWVLLALRENEKADSDITEYLRLANEREKNVPYAVLAKWVAARRSGQTREAARAVIAAWLEKGATKTNAEKNAWPLPVMQYLNDGITADQLLAAAYGSKDHLTDAQTFIGLELSFEGKYDAARDYLLKVLPEKTIANQQQVLAYTEIARIAATAKK